MALENESTLTMPNNVFSTKSVFDNDTDVVLGSLDAAQYPNAAHPYTTEPVFLPDDPWHEWTVSDQLAGQFFRVEAEAPQDLVVQQRDAEGNWIGEAGLSPFEGSVNGDGPGDYANAISVRVGVAGDGFQGAHGLGFGYSLFAEVPDADYLTFVGQVPGSSFFAEISTADFDPFLGWFDDGGELVNGDDDGGNGNLARIVGIVPDDGEVNLAVTGTGDAAFNGNHGETGAYELSFATTSAFFPIVLENAATGTFVVVAGGVSRRPVEYTLSDDADGRFDIDPLTGLVTVEDGSKIDYEAAAAHQVEVTTTFLDGATSPIVDTLTIFVRDINEAPSAIALDNLGVDENATVAIIGVLTTEDQDIGDSHVYQSSDLRFEVVDGQLKLRDSVGLDHESEPSVALTITAIDEGGLSVEQPFTIAVGDVNEAPDAVDDAGGTTENAAVTIDVLANDIDADAADGPANFSLDSVSIASVSGLVGSGTGTVSIDGNHLRFDPGSDFDELDEGGTATVVVDYTMSDDDGASGAAQATITVTGVNDAPVVADVFVAALEDGPAVASTFLGDDVDAGEDGTTLTYTITSVPSEGRVVGIENENFSFDPGADFQDLGEGETRDVSFRYIATDSAGAVSNSATVTVTVTGVNDAPMLDVNAGKTVDEGSVGLLKVSELSASDADDTDAEIVYTVTTAPAHGRLALAANQGMAITQFTQEDLAAARVVYIHDGGETVFDSFLFDVNDPNGTGPESQLFAITVRPVNDPPVLDVNALVIQEDETKLIGPETLRAIDPDTDPQGLTFAIGELSGGHFERVIQPGIAIAQFTQADVDSAYIQFVHDGGEQPPAYTVTLSDGPETVGPFAADITFEGVNDAPILEVNAGKTVDEGSAGLLRVSELSASDADDTDAEIVYTVTTAPAHGRLALAANQEVAITQFTQEDLAAARVVYIHDGGETVFDSFLFDVDDPDGTGPESQLFAITVRPVNDPPALDVNALVIQEGETKLIGPETLRAIDPDTDPDDLTFTIGDLTGGQFERVFEPGVAIDQFTQADIDSAYIQFVHDGGELPPAYTVTLSDGPETVGPFAADITFEGVNDAPIDLSLSNNRVGENASDGTIVGTLWATDPDTEDGFLYGLTDDGGGAFAVDPITGRLTVDNPLVLDFENPAFEGEYSIEVSVSDPGGENYSERMDIVLTDFNEAPTAIEPVGGDVLPNPGNGTIVATLTTIDPDTTAWSPVPESFTYALLDNARGRFSLDGDEIVVADGTRIEQGQDYELLVRSTDKGGLSIDQVVIISADAPPLPSATFMTQGAVSLLAEDDMALDELNAEDSLIYA